MNTDNRLQNTKNALAGENGSVMVLSLLILVIASIIGVITINTSTMETRVASSDREEKENFYRAEGAAMLAAQLIELANEAYLENRTEDYINGDVDFTDINQWTDGQTDYSTEVDANYASADDGIALGSSLDLSNETKLHLFRVYGRHTSRGNETMIEIEYRKRY